MLQAILSKIWKDGWSMEIESTKTTRGTMILWNQDNILMQNGFCMKHIISAEFHLLGEETT